MGFFSLNLVWNEADTLPNSEDMRINGKGFSSHAKKKETVNGFWTDPFEASHGSLDFFRTHLF
jgi:hypothetical protein